MFICLCNKINDKMLQKVIKDFSCKSLEDVQRYLPVATCCGKCRQTIIEVLHEKDDSSLSDSVL
ncbi:MAG: (2Fe-2S)-binding protein [Actinobacteria bacterium]|nr:(2Fe-2S)-binding protein [Actinomycetota bacterium]